MTTSTTAATPQEPTTADKMRAIPWSIAADSANTIFAFLTFFGTPFILFLDALGLDKGQIGILLSFFPFAGLIALVVAPAVARFGYKRTFITFWGLRKIITVFFLLTPWVIAQFGGRAALFFVSLITIGFALSRAIAETGKYPWTQEYIPNQIRGKYSAVNNLFTTIVGFIAVTASGLILQTTTGLSEFMLLFGIGLIFGFIGVWAYSFIPGGQPVVNRQERSWQRALREAIGDASFRNYLIGIALMTLATTPMTSFLPLFMTEQVGLSDSQVVLLQNGSLIGGLLSVYLWGWAADRFGSMPVMVLSVLLILFFPISLILIPRQSALSFSIALAISFFQGAFTMGWGIGSGRLLFVRVVPPEKKTDYMALYYSWIGLVGGISQLVGGWVLQEARGISGRLLYIQLDPYTPLFLIGLGLPLIGLLFLRGVQRDSSISVGKFVGLLFQGNPLMAMESMIRYHLARDEQATVIHTERMGQAKNLMLREELLEALEDPRFNVRFEAIVAIARTRPDDQLIAALARVLMSSDPALSVMAAWALGRLGDERAQEALRAGLQAPYRSIRAHSARALGTLGDQSAAAVLLERLHQESDHGLSVAYAAALGQLKNPEAVPLILSLLEKETEPTARIELALALARIHGEENNFIHLQRQLGQDSGTTAAQALAVIARKVSRAGAPPASVQLLTRSGEAFALGDLTGGIERLLEGVREIPETLLDGLNAELFREIHGKLAVYGEARPEYLLLLLQMLEDAD